MKIAICDDDMNVCIQLKEYICKYCIQRDKEVEVQIFATAAELLAAPCDYTILFLDIMLDDAQDGIEIGKALRLRDNHAVFVIISFRTDRYSDAFEATTFRYLVKPFDQVATNTILDQALEHISMNNQYLRIQYRQKTDYVNIRGVLYIESYMRKSYIYTVGGNRLQTTETWKSLLQRFGKYTNFYRPQKMFLINMNYIKSNSKTAITMTDGREIPLSKHGYKEFQIAMNVFCGDCG